MWSPSRTVRLLLWGGLASVAGGAVLCVVGWYGVSGEVLVARQLPYLASSTAPGAALLVAGAVLLAGWVRTEASRPVHPEPEPGPEPSSGLEPSSGPEPLSGPEPSSGGAAGQPTSTGPPLRVPGGTLAHRPDCPLVTGHPEAVPAGDAELDPCPVCEPWPR
ncbi:hypothetical protein ACFYU9_28030 [Streptomyces sp. NPDC004327]|uniref:hypothetical protein n=1 Tax=Streptomyces sp. NPDC004327 TaxID=3364699 RepID=UPI0036C68123